jgi:hypothetical protein
MDAFVMLFTVFVLAIFVGFEIITKVPPLLHTPLMSGSNAISGITIIGAMIAVATEAGCRRSSASSRSSSPRQRRRRVPRDAPHARHVQEEGLSEGADCDALRSLILAYLARFGPLHPRPERTVAPAHGRARQPVRCHRHADRHRGHALQPAILTTSLEGWAFIGAGLVVGATAGVLLATRVQMTAMPQMVALLNGFGGAASVLVAGGALIDTPVEATTLQITVATAASGLIGGVTFWGSLVAFDKLQGAVPSRRPGPLPRSAGRQRPAGAVALGFGAYIVIDPSAYWAYWRSSHVASILGVLLTLPIGGADMPVAIALLNSYSGLAGAATGFVLDNSCSSSPGRSSARRASSSRRSCARR